MLQQKGLTGARARRRGLSDSALGATRRHLSYKTVWYGSHLVTADRWFPWSKTCHACGHVQDIGWAEHWQCADCSVSHERDDCAAVNLARYEEPASVVGPVGPPSSAEPTVRPNRAGPVAMKRGGDAAARPPNNPETGCESRDPQRSLARNGCASWSRLRLAGVTGPIRGVAAACSGLGRDVLADTYPGRRRCVLRPRSSAGSP
jgi:hypothetical protein